MSNTFKEIQDSKSYVEELLAGGATVKQYKKSARITARQGVIGEKVSTDMANGLHETDNVVTADAETGKPGWIVTNPTGEQYIVSDSVFQSKYELVEGTTDVFAPVGKPVDAVQITEDITITASWGKQNIAAGGYLIISNMSDIYGIQEDEFNTTYESVTA